MEEDLLFERKFRLSLGEVGVVAKVDRDNEDIPLVSSIEIEDLGVCWLSFVLE